SGRVIFTSIHSYFSAMTANYVFIDCERFSKVVRISNFFLSISFEKCDVFREE
ncbi:unnamed protein product, partial [Rotaria magnacalcarata]